MKQQMVEHVAKRLCRAALIIEPDMRQPIVCPICENDISNCIWPSFIPEAEAAIGAVRDFALLSFRNKPKI